MAKAQRGAKKLSSPTRKSSRKRGREGDEDDDHVPTVAGGAGSAAGKRAARAEAAAAKEDGPPPGSSAKAKRQAKADAANVPPSPMAPPHNILAPPGAGLTTSSGVPLTPQQQQASPRHALAIAFKLNPNPTLAEMEALATFLQLETSTVSAWFERRRQLDVWAREMMQEAMAASAAATPVAQAAAAVDLAAAVATNSAA